MKKITLIFTKRNWNPVSWLIRFCIPRSRFAMSISSHCLIDDGDNLIEASMFHGVRRVPREVALKGLTVVGKIDYSVPDAEAGLAWARSQVGTRYDFRGAFGLALSPYREWLEDDAWFCYELGGATLVAAGKNCFRSVGHISETILLAINPDSCHTKGINGYD